MKKADRVAFVDVLNVINKMGINTKSGLMADQLLYSTLGSALKEFVHFALLSKTGGVDANGKIRPGNCSKIETLENRGVATRDDIESDCIIKIIDNLDMVLHQPLGKQKNYCYTICKNIVNDSFRKLPKDIRFVSLNSPIMAARKEDEDAYTYEHVIPDETYNPERMRVERETISELREQLRAKRIEKQKQQREEILRTVAILSNRPAELMVTLAVKTLHKKNRELASMILKDGCDRSYARIIGEITRKNNIAPEEIHSLTAGQKPISETFKAENSRRKPVMQK